MLIVAFTIALSCGGVSAAQPIEFRGDDSTFAVIAVATAKVAVQPPFLQVTVSRSILRATAVAKDPRRVTGVRINLVHALPSGSWEPLRKSELVPLNAALGHLDSVSIEPHTFTIPIDGINNLRDKWLVFEVDVDGTPPGFTYSHSQKLTGE